MAGIRGNVAWLLAQKQVSKGTAATIATANAHKVPFSGGNIGPSRETDNLSETDASRDRGITYVTTSGVEGSPEFYVRDASIGFWLWAALGADAISGTMPNYVHAITPTNNLPYITCWRNIGDTLWEQYRDCKVGSLTIAAEAGQPLVATANVMGLQTTRLTATPDTATPITIASGPVYNFNNATVTLAGGVTALVSSFELTIENNVTAQQTDAVEPYDVYEGQREVSLSFDLIFETLTEYNNFHYGSGAGTTVSPDVYTTSALFAFTKGANNDIAFNLPSIAYTEFPVEPSAAGDAIVSSISAAAQRGGSPVVTATVKNQVALY
jgi:hypothetical protein